MEREVHVSRSINPGGAEVCATLGVKCTETPRGNVRGSARQTSRSRDLITASQQPAPPPHEMSRANYSVKVRLHCAKENVKIVFPLIFVAVQCDY